MASVRSGTEAGRRPGDARSRRVGDYMDRSNEVFPSVSGRNPRRDTEDRRTTPRQASQPKVSSRIPQVPSQRRPSLPSPADRPLLNHQPQSWGSVASVSSGGSASHAYISSASSSSRLTTPSTGQPRNVLRRKRSGLGQETANTKNNSRSASSRGSSSSSSIPRSQNSLDAPSGAQFDRSLTESPMELRVAQRVELPKTSAQTVTIYPELDRYRDVKPRATPDSSSSFDIPYLTTQDLPPPTPLFSGTSSQVSGSPSTRFSGSPGPGPYSRDTTPTSISSQSPGLVAPMRLPTPKTRQISPAQTRPPVTRRRAGSISNEADCVGADPHGLAAVRESLTSSSSNSTVRDLGERQKKKKKRLSPLPPSPPPRKSSQKFHKGKDDDEDDSPPKRSRDHAQPATTSHQSPAIPGNATSNSQFLTSPKATPPVRPSRDGTPDLQSQLGLPFPVIHSNLSSASLSERRLSSTLPPSSLSRSTPETQLGSRKETSPTPHSAASRSAQSLRSPEIGITRTPSPNVSAFKTRFPIFGRRNKAAPEASQPENKEKGTTRKGPAAGTGHEGYGRLGTGRRRSSSSSTMARGLPGTMSSQESLDNSQTHDPFLRDRMAPVVIAGGEIIENRNTSSELNRTESNQSYGAGLSGVSSKNGSQASLSSREGPRNTLWPSAFPRSQGQGRGPGSRRPSDSSDSEAVAMKSTLAFRRSVQKVKTGEQQSQKLPKPIVTRPQVISPSMTSLDTSVLSDDSVFDPIPNTGRGRKGSTTTGKPNAPKKLTKRARSPRKWNFFGRSQSQPAVDKKTAEATKMVAATVQVVPTKPIAFYTMMDSSEQEDADLPDLEDVLREARAPDTPLSGIQAPRERRPSATRSIDDRRPSLTRPPTREGRSTASPQIPATEHRRQPSASPMTRQQRFNSRSPDPQPRARPTPTGPLQELKPPEPAPAPTPAVNRAPAPQPSTGRPSRLPQVGRIPKVVSARREHTSPKSFSRPFNRFSMHIPASHLEALDANSVAKGPSPPKPSTPELSHDGSTVTGDTTHSIAPVSGHGQTPPDLLQDGKEFLSFSPRKNSQCTVTTSSGSSGILTFANATAVVPEPNAPLAEDEIWDEYNDLLGEDVAAKAPPSAGSSMGRPFHLDVYATTSTKESEPPLESPTVHIMPRMNLEETLRAGLAPTASSSIYSTDMAAKVREALDISADPPTPFSVSEFVLGYGERNNSVGSANQVGARQLKGTSCESDDRQTRRSNASGSSLGSDDNSPLSQVNLRVGSMTVSKWLTFGHVIFSPLRDDLAPTADTTKHHSVLVIDGLGNDDWSFYAAETYPAATFFNLSPRAPLPVDHQNASSFPLSPPNHHQIQYASQAGKFPFSQQSFTSVVFRFPAAAPESHYRNVIAEAKRVLKPGGFIELSILDVDLNNMGNRGRRTVRQLKERIHTRAPGTSLGSTADLILRELGRKGFMDVKTCRVGVPVASAITRSSSSEGNHERNSSGGIRTSKDKPKKDQRTLAEMMSDDSAVADESITNMVAKVGRWWYSRCYETAAAGGPGGPSRSMWNDKALLAECEEWGTSLKLMVCHARMPNKARGASI